MADEEKPKERDFVYTVALAIALSFVILLGIMVVSAVFTLWWRFMFG